MHSWGQINGSGAFEAPALLWHYCSFKSPGSFRIISIHGLILPEVLCSHSLIKHYLTLAEVICSNTRFPFPSAEFALLPTSNANKHL